MQRHVVGRLTRQPPPHPAAAFMIHLAHTLHHFEQSRTASDAVCLERWRDGETYRLFRAALVGHDKVGGQRVEPTVHTLYRSIKRLQVDGYVSALRFCHDAVMDITCKVTKKLRPDKLFQHVFFTCRHAYLCTSVHLL